VGWKLSFNQSIIPIAVILLFVSALIYLPLVNQLGYYNDDWYLMYAGHSQGPEIFKLVFSIDRPARSLIMSSAYFLFKNNALFYNISGYIFRLLGAISLVWLLQLLWPKHRIAIMWIGVLFVIYPGFLSQINSIDYLSHLVGIFLGIFSITLYIQALITSKPIFKFILIPIAIITGWFYLGLFEYFIGLEVFRLLCISIIINRSYKNRKLLQKGVQIIRVWMPALIIPFGFLFWRLYLFENQRQATDIYAQLSPFFISPIQTLKLWTINLFQDTLNVIFLAWSVPLYKIAFPINSQDLIIGAFVGVLCIIVVALGILWIQNCEGNKDIQHQKEWLHEVIWIGLIAAIFGLLPITIANRHIIFPGFSRYTLVSSIGGVIFLVGLIYYLSSKRMQLFIFFLLILIAAVTHYANTTIAARETASLNNFWWQVSWRIPHLEKGTNIIANYPIGAIEEDYFVWGPANLIYYPEKSDKLPIQLSISATVLNKGNVINIISNKGKEFFYRRGLYLYRNFRKTLVITQPGLKSCVQVIDGKQPELSSYEDSDIMLIAPFSRIDRILLNKTFAHPPSSIFGQEPTHNWCYYYEKASLARQQNNWETIVRLGEEAYLKGFSPSDEIEWMPFLQAYIILGEKDKIQQIAPLINKDPFVKAQVCKMLNNMVQTNYINEKEYQILVQLIPCQSLHEN